MLVDNTGIRRASTCEWINDADSGACFDETRTYRYSLWRRWKPPNPDQSSICGDLILWVMLNPSTADENVLDPTIKRCVGYSKDWGFSGLVVTNLFAYRATVPGLMKKQGDPTGGERCERAIQFFADRCQMVMAGWGNHGAHQFRSKDVLSTLRECGPVYHLGLNKSGEPKHPLYLRSDVKSTLWE